MKRIKFHPSLTTCKASASDAEKAAAEAARVFEDDLNDLLGTTSEYLAGSLQRLLTEHGPSILSLHNDAPGPFVVPKDLMVAVLLREAGQWAAPGMKIETTGSRFSSAVRRSVQNIRRFLRAL